MTRVKRGFISRKRHKKILKLTKGFLGSGSVLFRVANQTILKAFKFSYKSRKHKKREFRKLWIARINNQLRKQTLINQELKYDVIRYNCSRKWNYSLFRYGLKKNKILLNRKYLALLSIQNPKLFQNIRLSMQI